MKLLSSVFFLIILFSVAVPGAIYAAECDALSEFQINPPFTRIDQTVSIRGKLQNCPKDRPVQVFAQNPNGAQKTGYSSSTTTTDTGEFFIFNVLFPEGGTWDMQLSVPAGIINTGKSIRVESIQDTKGNVITPTRKVPPSNTPIPSITPPCKDTNPDGSCKTFPTAIGNVDTDPIGFIKRLFGLLLGLSGGIAVVLIIISGYQLMTSQGNKEAIQAARDRITSAIVGLLFLVFSLVILQVIGVDILSIPGFSAR